MKLTEAAYEWAKIPVDLPKENLVLITARTLHPTIHPEDIEYPIRYFKEEEMKEAARSLAQRVIGLNHISADKGGLIDDAFTVDAQWNTTTKALEALLYLPRKFIQLIKEGMIKKVSVEYTWRDEKRTTEGVEFSGVCFNRVDLLYGLNAGDTHTSIKLVEGKSKVGLLEGEILTESGETEIKQDQIQASVERPSLSFFKDLEEAATFFKRMGEPFAGYKDFDDCISKNKDKDNPKAYCGYIMHKVEESKKESLATMVMNDTLPSEDDKIIMDIPLPELEEAEKVQGYEPPEAGTLPKAGRDILAKTYASCRSDNPDYSKERCSKIAWGAVKNAGYSQKDGEWTKTEAEPQPTGLIPTPEDMPSDVTVNSDNPKDVEPLYRQGGSTKQTPELPVNKITTPDIVSAPVLNQKPVSPEKPIVNVGSIGFVADDKGGPIITGAEGQSLEKSIPIKGDDIEVSKGDKSKQLVESVIPSSETKVLEKKEEVKQVIKPAEQSKEISKSPELVKIEVPIPSTPTPTPEMRIKELEKSIAQVQEAIKTKDTEAIKKITEATKEKTKELVREIEALLPSGDIISNFNYGGQILARDLRKVLYRLKKENGIE